MVCVCLFTTGLSISVMAQTEGVSIKTTASAPDASAMLDVESTTKGLLIPRVALTGTLTSSSPISTTPANGLLVFNTSSGTPGGSGFYYWNNFTWNPLSGLWNIDPAATPTAAGGIYRNGVVTVGQSTATVAATSPLTSTLMVFGPSVYYSQAAAPTTGGEYGIHIGEPNNHESISGGHANELNCYRQSLDMQWNTKQDVTMGAHGGSNLNVDYGATHDTLYGNIIADHNITAKGYMYSHNGLVITSDSTLKKNITPCTDVLTKLSNLNTYYYNYITESNSDQKHIGILAQQAARQYQQLVRSVTEITQDFSAIPEAGKTAVPTTTATYKGVDYQGLTSLLLQAVKELQAEINDLKTRVTTLETK
jgi:hypothetical protein